MTIAWDESGEVPLLHWTSAPEGIRVAFTGRLGGVSGGPFRSLNLGALTADDPGNVGENRRRAVEAAGADGAVATMAWQVHGAAVREVTAEPSKGRFLRPGAEPFPQSDGLVTSERGRPMTLLTADCLPVAVAAVDGTRLAVLHAGWRGLEGGIVEAGVGAVGASAVAAVGPGAGPCCYEVGDDVAEPLRRRFGEDVVQGGKANLWLCAERALRSAGVEVVDVASECTICTPERYFSHRRDNGVTGRQGVVGLVA
ncbi:MAG: purine-nucleoside/S-methyl-5-thioadenosine phosphorylase / adenosine deaminase [Gaiellales bacterium]|nr:purine-nucleoside/S-methyl-5-thioadenosine phosphorylase / adenosine deaminase [Gaiellales bacterium]